MTVALAFGLGLTIVGAGAPAWATTTPTATPAVTTASPTPTATDSPGSDDIFPDTTATPTPTSSATTAAPITVDVETSPTDSATPTTSATPLPLPKGFPSDLIPSGIRSDLPDLIKPDLKLRGVCGPTGVTWTLRNIIDKKIGYAFIDSKLTWGLGKLEPGHKVVLPAHGFAILALPLDAETGLPYKLPTIGFLPCKAAGFGVVATGATGVAGGGAAAAVPASTVVAVPATVATPIVTNNVHFTG